MTTSPAGDGARPAGPLSRRASAAVAIVLLALLAAAGAAGHGARGGAHVPSWAGGAATHVVAVLAIVLYPLAILLGIAVLLLGGVVRRGDMVPLPARPSRRARWAVRLGVFLVLLLLLRTGALRPGTDAIGRLFHLNAIPAGDAARRAGERANNGGIGVGDWVAAGILWALIAAAAVVLALRIRSAMRAARARAAAFAPDAAGEATKDDPDDLQAVLAALRREPDPRRAVVAAYAHMERRLARAGFARRHSEPPREYLLRAGGEGAPRGPMGRLTGLLERARFSPHSVSAAMKEEAILAVEELEEACGAPA